LQTFIALAVTSIAIVVGSAALAPYVRRALVAHIVQAMRTLQTKRY